MGRISVEEAALLTGASPQFIRMGLQKGGREMRSKIPDSAIPQIVQMISEGRDAWEIAVLCRVTKSGVRYIVDKFNLFTEIQIVGRQVLEQRRKIPQEERADGSHGDDTEAHRSGRD